MTSVYFWNLSSVTCFSAKQIVIALAKVAITDTKFMPLEVVTKRNMGLWETAKYESTHSSGEAAEDNVEERENSEVTQFLVTGYRLRTDGRTDGQRDVKVEILF